MALNFGISSITAAYGLNDRAYLLLPGILIVTLFFEMEKTRNEINLFPVVLMVTMFCSLYGYMYRDTDISLCNTRIETGVYKGIYTTEEKARYLEELEKYLQRTIKSEEYVFAQQSFPALYLMSKGTMLTPTSWSASVFADGYTGNDYVRNYFEFVEKEPDIYFVSLQWDWKKGKYARRKISFLSVYK